MTDLPVRRTSHARASQVRPMPYRGGRTSPFAVRADVQTDKTSGVEARVLADQQRAKGGKG
jgi:hypothetical protein